MAMTQQQIISEERLQRTGYRDELNFSDDDIDDNVALDDDDEVDDEKDDASFEEPLIEEVLNGDLTQIVQSPSIATSRTVTKVKAETGIEKRFVAISPPPPTCSTASSLVLGAKDLILLDDEVLQNSMHSVATFDTPSQQSQTGPLQSPTHSYATVPVRRVSSAPNDKKEPHQRAKSIPSSTQTLSSPQPARYSIKIPRPKRSSLPVCSSPPSTLSLPSSPLPTSAYTLRRHSSTPATSTGQRPFTTNRGRRFSNDNNQNDDLTLMLDGDVSSTGSIDDEEMVQLAKELATPKRKKHRQNYYQKGNTNGNKQIFRTVRSLTPTMMFRGIHSPSSQHSHQSVSSHADRQLIEAMERINTGKTDDEEDDDDDDDQIDTNLDVELGMGSPPPTPTTSRLTSPMPPDKSSHLFYPSVQALNVENNRINGQTLGNTDPRLRNCITPSRATSPTIANIWRSRTPSNLSDISLASISCVTALHLSTFAIFGAILRVFVGRFFGGDCETQGVRDFLLPVSQYVCITSSGTTGENGSGALFIDLPANMLGCFFMGYFSYQPKYKSISKNNEKRDYHDAWMTAIKTGLCGSLTTFASWNAQMIVIMDGTYTAFDTPQIGSALFGYIIGIMAALCSFIFGTHVSFCRYHGFSNEEEKSIVATTSSSSCENQHTMLKSVANPKPMSAPTSLSNQKMFIDNDNNNNENDYSTGAPLTGWRSFLWDVRRVPYVVLLGFLVAFWIGDFVLEIPFYRSLWLSSLLSPLGAMLRWKLSPLNSIHHSWCGGTICPAGARKDRERRQPWLPWGTFTCNVLGSCVSIALLAIYKRNAQLSGSNENPWTDAWLNAIRVGFAGSLSTVSTFVKELIDLQSGGGCVRSYHYACLTFLVSIALSLLIYIPIVRG